MIIDASTGEKISACSGNSEVQLRLFDTLTSKICSFERNRWDVRGEKWEEKPRSRHLLCT